MIIVNFFKGLFDAEGRVSSKRVSGIEVLQVCIIMALGSQFTQYKLDYPVFLTLIGFVLGCFGMNLAETTKAMSVKGDVASDMVEGKSYSANEDAKDVLKADKP